MGVALDTCIYLWGSVVYRLAILFAPNTGHLLLDTHIVYMEEDYVYGWLGCPVSCTP